MNSSAATLSAIPPIDPPPNNPRLYEINTRVWFNERRFQTLADVSDSEIDTWSRNFDIIWLMGVWRPSEHGRHIAQSHAGLAAEIKGVLPGVRPADVVCSPYSVKEYAVSPLLGGNPALAHLRSRLHKRGLRLMLDLVPNHMAVDHPWVSAYPDRFIGGTPEDMSLAPQNFFETKSRGVRRIFAHGKDPYYDGWRDTVQVNIFNPDMRRAMIDLMMCMTEICDAIRCDMAMLLLTDVFSRTWGAKGGPAPDTEFWKEAVTAVKMHRPDFIFLAEVYWDMESRLQDFGFDYTYDKKLYDLLREGAPEPIRRRLRAPGGFQARSARMIENHDEKRAVAVFGGERSKAAAMMTYAIPGLRFFHEGQVEGRAAKIPVQLTRRPTEPVDEAIRDFYSRLQDELSLDVLLNGAWQMIDPVPAWAENPSYKKLFAFWWQLNGDVRLVVVNYADHPSQGYFRLPLPKSISDKARIRDCLSDRVYDRDADLIRTRGMYFDMPAYDAHLFEVGG